MINTLLLALTLSSFDTLTLARAHEAAAARDPRLAQIVLSATASSARIAAIETERNPQFALNAQATHQSDVTSLPIALPGLAIKRPPLDHIQATLDVQQLLYDAGARLAREKVERAHLAETDANLEVTRYALHAEVDRNFFLAWAQQVRASAMEVSAADLMGRLTAARNRVREGTGLPRDTAAIEAERLTVLQHRAEALNDRAAALQVLAQLTGLALDSTTQLELPSLDTRLNGITPKVVLDSLRARPEFALLQRTGERLDAEQAMTSTVNAPHMVAFGQAGVGRPGLNQFETSVAGFWIAGVKLEWHPFTWHSADLNAKAIEAQRRGLGDDAAALSEQLSRAATSDLSHISQLRVSLDAEERIATLRAVVDATAKTQFDEAAITASEYLTTHTALLESRLTLEQDRAELTRLQATLLTTLGLSLR